MKTFRIVLVVLGVLITSGLIRVSAQVEHWRDFPWVCDFWVDCPDSPREYFHGTLYQDFVVHFDKEGFWSKFNGKYDKSEFVAESTGETFLVWGAVNLSLGEKNCFIETLILVGVDSGTKYTIKTKVRVNGNGIVREVQFFHCGD